MLSFILSLILSIIFAILAIIFLIISFLNETSNKYNILASIFLAFITLISILNINIPKPIITPINTEHDGEIEITIESIPIFKTYYSLDGSDPKDCEIYNGSFTLRNSTTVCARNRFLWWWGDFDYKTYTIRHVLYPQLSEEDLNQLIKDIENELELLKFKLDDLSKEDDDALEKLNYHRLLSIMEYISDYYFFLDIVRYMDEAGYNVEYRTISSLLEQFYDMPYDEQVDIISRMFVHTSTYEYKVYSNYKYNIFEDNEGNLYVDAEATSIETHKIPIYVYRGKISNTFGALKRTVYTNDLYYFISYRH